MAQKTDKKEPDYRQISMDEAVKIMNSDKKHIILDVRHPDEYAEGRIPGAINVANEIIGQGDISELADKNALILVYCRSGRRSKEAAEKLVKLGYTNIVEFGGILDWQGKIEKQKPLKRSLFMQYFNINSTPFSSSRIALGTWRFRELSAKQLDSLIKMAVDCGINFFDHANIYGGGECERLFGEILTPALREKIIIQSKCGIHDGYFDFSKQHIIESVEKSLERLKTDYLDILLLHRPDALVEPEEVAEAFDELERRGLVRHFGVSNHNSLQIELLQRSVKQKICVNQLQFSIAHSSLVRVGLNVNMENEAAVNRDEGVLDYCRLKDITVQSWSPFQYGFAKGCFVDSEEFRELNEKLSEIAKKHGSNKSETALAWILRHPAGIQPILGTTSPERVLQVKNACEINLSRKEWYDIFKAAGNVLP